MESILNQSKYATEENNIDTIPLFPLVEKIKGLIEMPCHLILNDEREISKFG